MNLNYKYLFKNLFFNTNEIIKEFYTDFRKDQNSKYIKKKPYRIWIFGLPKSGTTLVEQIMDQLPYIRVDRSVLRKFSNKDLLDTKNYKEYLHLDNYPKKQRLRRFIGQCIQNHMNVGCKLSYYSSWPNNHDSYDCIEGSLTDFEIQIPNNCNYIPSKKVYIPILTKISEPSENDIKQI